MQLLLLLFFSLWCLYDRNLPFSSKRKRRMAITNTVTTLSFTTKTVKNNCGDTVLFDDILVEIMCRLPEKDIIRFKSVSKSFNRLISHVVLPRIQSALYGLFVHTAHFGAKCPDGPWDFSFMNGRNYSLVDPAFFVHPSFPNLPFTPVPKKFLDCCNGFLLFFDPLSLQFFLCNPCTEQCVAIPYHKKRKHCRVACLAFENSSFYVVHFSRKPLEMYIYSSLTGKWTVRRGGMYFEGTINDAPWSKLSVYLDGYFYRLSLSMHLLKFGLKKIGAMAFKLPEVVSSEIGYGVCGVSQGRIHYSWDDEKYNLMVWMLDESDRIGKWVLKYTLLLQDLAKYPLPTVLDSRLFSVFAFDPNSDVVFLGHSTGIFTYHPGSKKLKKVFQACYGAYLCCGPIYVFPYTRNLAPLDVSVCASKAE